ncbi:LURP-one-related/scramblase family protein [Methanomassiliicoccus luminyensis]|jgi:uncharacterized protein YxjI|uniref:hypothetical protein n=1 Tax=Methanomassiliicoccus luminyensis TaxID=1080712 RepID=UPI00037A1ABC|nr:hypothetical protein [Methanomassiliicoccus luminyensis]
MAAAETSIWYQNYYRTRKKVLAVASQYWIEDANGKCLGYAKQKMLRMKEDIRIYSDESMATELFRIKQEQIMDVWGTYSVIDSFTNAVVGKVRRSVMSGIGADEWQILDPAGQQIGRIVEMSGRGLARKYIPLGNLVPEQVKVEFYGQEVGQIKQQFKIVGDTWEVDCCRMPPQLDRRVLLAGMVMMGMVERERK